MSETSESTSPNEKVRQRKYQTAIQLEAQVHLPGRIILPVIQNEVLSHIFHKLLFESLIQLAKGLKRQVKSECAEGQVVARKPLTNQKADQHFLLRQ